MSTRRATYVTVDDLLDQVGSVDVFRWFMVTRSPESHLNFDLDAAMEQDWQKNPVFYVQYAHARVASVFNHARERGVAVPAGLERGRPRAARGARGAGPREDAAALPAHGRRGRAGLRAAPDRRLPLRAGGAAPRVPSSRHPHARVPDRAARGARADPRPTRARAGGRPGHPERARSPGNLRAGVHVRRRRMIATRRLGRTRHEFRFGTRELVVIGAVFCLIAGLVFAGGVLVGREMTRGKSTARAEVARGARRADADGLAGRGARPRRRRRGRRRRSPSIGR